MITLRLVAYWAGARSNAAMIRALATGLVFEIVALAPVAHAEVVGQASVIDGDTLALDDKIGQRTVRCEERDRDRYPSDRRQVLRPRRGP